MGWTLTALEVLMGVLQLSLASLRRLIDVSQLWLCLLEILFARLSITVERVGRMAEGEVSSMFLSFLCASHLAAISFRAIVNVQH
jgi:hypothetical protein